MHPEIGHTSGLGSVHAVRVSALTPLTPFGGQLSLNVAGEISLGGSMSAPEALAIAELGAVRGTSSGVGILAGGASAAAVSSAFLTPVSTASYAKLGPFVGPLAPTFEGAFGIGAVGVEGAFDIGAASVKDAFGTGAAGIIDKTRSRLAVAGAISIIGAAVWLGGLMVHFVVGGPVPSFIAGMSMLGVSAALWYGKHQSAD